MIKYIIILLIATVFCEKFAVIKNNKIELRKSLPNKKFIIVTIAGSYAEKSAIYKYLNLETYSPNSGDLNLKTYSLENSEVHSSNLKEHSIDYHIIGNLLIFDIEVNDSSSQSDIFKLLVYIASVTEIAIYPDNFRKDIFSAKVQILPNVDFTIFESGTPINSDKIIGFLTRNVDLINRVSGGIYYYDQVKYNTCMKIEKYCAKNIDCNIAECQIAEFRDKLHYTFNTYEKYSYDTIKSVIVGIFIGAVILMNIRVVDLML